MEYALSSGWRPRTLPALGGDGCLGNLLTRVECYSLSLGSLDFTDRCW